MKNIEEKFEEYIKDNSMKRMYMSDYIKAGYEIAKKEIILEIERRWESSEWFLNCAYPSGNGNSYYEQQGINRELKDLLDWIKSNDEKGSDG